MNIGIQIKKILIDLNKNQRWLSQKTGIDYDTLNSSLNGKRTLKYEELELILWATGKTASDVITPQAPKQPA